MRPKLKDKNPVGETLYGLAKKNKRLRAFNELIEGGRFSIDTQKYLDELDTLHLSRKSRSIKFASKSVITENVTLLVAAIQDNMIVRSRVVSIKMECYKVSYLLEQHIESLRPYLRDKYMSVLRQNYRTEGERNAALETCFKHPLELISNLDMVVEMADIIINDIDQSYWSLKGISDAFAVNAPKSTSI